MTSDAASPRRQPRGSRRFRWRRLGWLALLIPVLPLAAVHLMAASFHPPPVEEVFAGRPLPERHLIDLPDGHRIGYVETGEGDGPLVLFIHGTPGSWDAFMRFLSDPALPDRARVVSVDRPGWGAASAGGVETSLAAQARACAAVLAAHPGNRPAVVVGHSLGGAVAARIAIDFPAAVDAVILVAGSIDPAAEATTWYQAVARWPVVRPLLPEELVHADDELVAFRSELEAMLPLWGRLRAPVTVIQGMDDGLVDPGNAAFAERRITAAPLRVERIPGQGHLIPWQRPDLITEAVLRALDAARFKGDSL